MKNYEPGLPEKQICVRRDTGCAKEKSDQDLLIFHDLNFTKIHWVTV